LSIEGSHLAEPDQITYVERHPEEKPSQSLVNWFTAHAGCKSFDATAIDIVDIPGQGRGVIALIDLPVRNHSTCSLRLLLTRNRCCQEGYTLFTIPRDLVLSTRTSDLPRRFGKNKWKECQLDKGWAGLILCMMWEESLGSQSRWHGYLGLSRIKMYFSSLC
jgi:N-lysine methyltransferase SETD6